MVAVFAFAALIALTGCPMLFVGLVGATGGALSTFMICDRDGDETNLLPSSMVATMVAARLRT